MADSDEMHQVTIARQHCLELERREADVRRSGARMHAAQREGGRRRRRGKRGGSMKNTGTRASGGGGAVGGSSGEGGEAPIKCITFLSGFGYKSALISTPFAIQVKNSSDLGMGRRPKSESDEFLSCIVKVIEIFTGPRFDFLPSSANFLGASPHG